MKTPAPVTRGALIASAVATSGGEFPQHIVQDAAVHIIFDLVRRIDAAERVEAEGRAVGAGDVHVDRLARRQVRDARDGELVVDGQAQRLARLAIDELQRQHAHADEVRAVATPEALARKSTRLNSSN